MTTQNTKTMTDYEIARLELERQKLEVQKELVKALKGIDASLDEIRARM